MKVHSILKIKFKDIKTAERIKKNGITLFYTTNLPVNIENEKFTPIKQCMKCFSYEHTRFECKVKSVICSECASKDHVFYQCKSQFKKCVVCGGNHRTFSNLCQYRKDSRARAQVTQERVRVEQKHATYASILNHQAQKTAEATTTAVRGVTEEVKQVVKETVRNTTQSKNTIHLDNVANTTAALAYIHAQVMNMVKPGTFAKHLNEFLEKNGLPKVAWAPATVPGLEVYGLIAPPNNNQNTYVVPDDSDWPSLVAPGTSGSAGATASRPHQTPAVQSEEEREMEQDYSNKRARTVETDTELEEEVEYRRKPRKQTVKRNKPIRVVSESEIETERESEFEQIKNVMYCKKVENEVVNTTIESETENEAEVTQVAQGVAVPKPLEAEAMEQIGAQLYSLGQPPGSPLSQDIVKKTIIDTIKKQEILQSKIRQAVNEELTKIDEEQKAGEREIDPPERWEDRDNSYNRRQSYSGIDDQGQSYTIHGTDKCGGTPASTPIRKKTPVKMTETKETDKDKEFKLPAPLKDGGGVKPKTKLATKESTQTNTDKELTTHLGMEFFAEAGLKKSIHKQNKKDIITAMLLGDIKWTYCAQEYEPPEVVEYIRQGKIVVKTTDINWLSKRGMEKIKSMRVPHVGYVKKQMAKK